MTFNPLPADKPKIVSNEATVQIPPSSSKRKKPKKVIEKAVEESTKDKLPPELETKANNGWGVWSWLGLGKKAETLVEEQGDFIHEQEDEQDSSSMSQGDLTEDLREEVLIESPKAAVVEKELETHNTEEAEQPILTTFTPKVTKKEKLEKTAIKTYQVAQKSALGKIGGGVLGAVVNTLVWTGAKTGAIQTLVDKTYGISDEDKDATVASLKKEMRNQLDDPQFVQLYEIVSTALIPTIKEKVLDDITQKQGTVYELIASQESLILKLVEVVLARGFANLARNVKENATEIPNFGKQPSLVSVISLLGHKAGQHIDQKKLEEIEKNYRQDQIDLNNHIEKLFPGIEDDPKSKESLQLYIQEYIQWNTDKSRQSKIKTDLFPKLKNIGGKKGKDIQAFFTTLDSLQLKSKEMHKVFTQLSEDVLLCLFPKKFQGIDEISGWGLSLVEIGFNFDSLTNIIADLIQESYVPMENNVARNEAWEKDLTTRLGAPDLKPVVQAPSALLVAFAKNYIQSDPSIVQTTSRLIDDMLWQGQVFSVTAPIKPHLQQIKEELEQLKKPDRYPYKDMIEQRVDADRVLIEDLEAEIAKFGQGNQNLNDLKMKKADLQKLQTHQARAHLDQLNNEIDQLISLQKNRSGQKKNILDELSQQQLASWIVKSVQSMLNTEDVNLIGIGQFVQQSLNNLTLALLTKGAKLVLPEGETVEPHAFIKEFSERLIEKASSLQGEEAISEEFWKDFVNDLPLPPLVKTLLVPVMVEKAKSMQETFKKSAPDIQEIQKVYEDALQKVEDYEEGKQLLAITESISDQIIGLVLEKNIGLISTIGLGETVEELFAQYLPGITFDENLKDWFKGNISALGVTEGGQTPQSIVLLKQGIQAVMLKAIVNTIEKNFQNNSKDYAAQLLKNFHEAFSKAFTEFDDIQRKQLDNALNIQIDIDNKNDQLKANQELAAKKPDGITSDQIALLEGIITANTRYIRASSYIDTLKEKREQILTSLNRRQKKRTWTAADLPIVNEALALRKNELSNYARAEEYVASLRARIIELNSLEKKGNISSIDKSELEQRQLLITLMAEMSSDALKQLSEASHIHATLQHAENELDHLHKELKEKEEAIVQYDKGMIQNQNEWNTAKNWKDKVLTSKKESVQIARDIAGLEKDLDTHLAPFKVLSKELTGLLGLDKKEKLDLPPFLQDQVWPLIESAQEKQIARLLFTQIAPLLISVTDLDENKDKLEKLSKGNPFLGQLIHAASEDIIERIPEYLTSYKPFANDILAAAGNSHPTDEEITFMEASLTHKLIELGKNGTTASMLKSLIKDLVPEAREDAFSQSIAKLIPLWNDKKLPRKKILDLLKKEIITTTSKEEENLEKKAELLAKNINQFLFNRGKANLEPRHLVDAYNDQAKTKAKTSIAEIKKFENNLLQNKTIEKIKTVIITPEEIATALNDAIPGATDLHSLIAPQLQAVIVGQDVAFKENREVLQKFLEGTILRLFVKIAEANQSPTEDPLTVITGKLKDLVMNAVPKNGQTPEEAARQMIDQVLSDVLDINSHKDFDNIPASLQQLAYDKVKEQAYQQLTPLLMPIIERNQNRTILKNKSGSNFLGSLCEALSKDVFSLAPTMVKSYHAISNDLFVLLSNGKTPTPKQVEQFAAEIANLVKEKDVNHQKLLQAYSKITKKTLDLKKQNELITKLNERKAKDEINNILITPEEIAKSIAELVPHLDSQLQKALANEMQKMIHGGSGAYLNGASFAGAYIEGVLLKVFINVAEKNPKQVSTDVTVSSKDSMVVLTEKLLDITVKKYQEAKNGKDFEIVAQELNDTIMEEVLGIDSPAAFKGLPDGLQSIAYNSIKDQLGGMLINIQKSLSTLDNAHKQVQQVRQDVKGFGIAENATKAYAQILAEDIANMVVLSVPHVLSETPSSGGEMMGVVNISKGVEGYLEELARGNVQIAKVLLSYAQGDQFKKLLGDNLGKLADQSQFVDDKKMAADILGNLLLEPMSKALDKAISFEEQHKKQFNQKLMANLFHVGAEHLKHLNDAKALAAKQERKDFTHEDFIKVVGSELHPGVPTAPISYQKSIDAITDRIYGSLSPDQEKAWLAERDSVRQLIVKMVRKEAKAKKIMNLDDFIKDFELIHLKVVGKPLTLSQKNALKVADKDGFNLRNIIRKEAEAPTRQKREAAYDPATEAILKMVFPNGQSDISFVPENLQGIVWNLFKDQLFPVVLPILTETILDPSTINTIVLSSLETVRDSLSEDIVLSNEPPEPKDLPLDELDQASGELIAQVLRATTLPEWAKKFLIDPKTGEISESMKKTIGAALRQQFNDTFIKDKLKIALESAVKRDASGNPILNFDTRPKEVKKAEDVKKAEQMQKDLKKATREVVNVSISYFIRSTWAKSQASFDGLVKSVLGGVGLSIKHALDQVFRFVFFKIIGSILYYPVTLPIKLGVQHLAYSILSIDKNRKNLLDLFTKVPSDQPEADLKKHAVYHEDLVFKIGQAFAETIEEFLENEPAIPMDQKKKPKSIIPNLENAAAAG